MMLNTDLVCIENVLFKNASNQATSQHLTSTDLINNNSLTDLSLVLFAYKACIDSLDRIIKMVAYLNGMDKELNQIFFLLISSPFRECLSQGNIAHLNARINLNQIVCLDFVLNACVSIVCDWSAKGLVDSRFRNLQVKNSQSFEILWKCLIEATFFCFYLQTNMNDELKSLSILANDKCVNESEANKENSPFGRQNTIDNLSFRSVYSSLNELVGNGEEFKNIKLTHSNTIDNAEIEANSTGKINY
jgi:hypothetical protein